ncbi:MAG TPA: putative PEP-binding protein [Thermoanaerobaculia bacterium]|nr:putative PEP-binding protein [Thermoanaerobaculia bacterium]
MLDAEEGVLRIAPDAATLAAAEQGVVRRRARRDSAEAAARNECRLATSERIEIFANVSAASEVAGALERGAEGCGLLRTEFLFLDRATPPAVEEQAAAYQSIVTAFAGRPVVIRTLDAGSDKPLRYLALPPADNPALGVRGIRAGLWRPELLRAQLRAILSVKPLDACRILVPMITDAAEVERVRRILEELSEELRGAVPALGMMIETPAAALTSALSR